MASIALEVLGTILFGLCWIFLAFPTRLGRTISTLLGALLTVVIGLLSSSDAFAAINLETIALLFGTMIMAIVMEREGLFQVVTKVLLYKCTTSEQLLTRICISSAVVAAFITNDTVCVFFTPMVLSLLKTHSLPPAPFLMAICTSANIGSIATVTGSPQAMLIASMSGIKYTEWVKYMLVITVVSIVINIIGLQLWFKQQLKGQPLHFEKCNTDETGLVNEVHEISLVELVGQTETKPHHRQSIEDMNSEGIDSELEVKVHEEKENTDQHLKQPDVSHSSITSRGTSRATSSSTSTATPSNQPTPSPVFPPFLARPYFASFFASHPRLHFLTTKLWYQFLCLLGTIVAFCAGAPLGWSAVGGATVMLILDYDFTVTEKVLEKVDYSLLIFFSCLFIVVAGFTATSLPAQLWNTLQPAIYPLARASGLTVYTLFVLIGSNIVSNVPLVLLLGVDIPKLGDEVKAGWLILAFVSTVAGNFTLVGSVANLIVVNGARHTYVLGFWEYTKYGMWSTLLVTVVGVILLWAMLLA